MQSEGVRIVLLRDISMENVHEAKELSVHNHPHQEHDWQEAGVLMYVYTSLCSEACLT